MQVDIPANNIKSFTGDSAGGNVAAAVTLKLRDEHLTPPLRLQLLLYPALQALDFNLPSYREHAEDPILPKHFVVAALLLYAQGMKTLFLDFCGLGSYLCCGTKRPRPPLCCRESGSL